MLYIILPAYNEAQALANLITDISKTCCDYPFRVIVVNDGSTDETGEIVRGLKEKYRFLELIEHPSNKGLGAALLTGFEKVMTLNRNADHYHTFAREDCPDVIMTMDADNTHPPDRIPLLLSKIKNGSDLAIASRYEKGGKQIGLTIIRRILSRGAGLTIGTVFPIPGVKDYSCGFRAYRMSVLDKALKIYGSRLIENNSFAAMVEVLIKVAPLCEKIEEVPLILHYERKLGRSKMKVMQTIWGYLKLIYRLKFEARNPMVWIPEK